MGKDAGCNQTTGSNNVFLGNVSGGGNTDATGTGDANIAIGREIAKRLTTGSYNIFMGNESASYKCVTGSRNVILGNEVGQNLVGGYDNVIIGSYSGCNICGSVYNVIIGRQNMCNGIMVEAGSDNIAIGRQNNQANTTGADNISIGCRALYINTEGQSNITLGKCAGSRNTTGSENIYLGNHAGTSGSSDPGTGDYNIALGRCAGQCVTSGSYNLSIGLKSGCNVTTGSRNIYIGFCHQASSSSVSCETVLGFNNATGKGTKTFFVDADSGVYHGGNTTTWSTTSDLRIKKNVTDNNTGLDKIKEVQVRNFEYRTKDEITDFENPSAVVVNKEGLQLGVIAQELQKILPDTVKELSTGALSVNADNLIWYLINAVKELSAKNDALEARIKKLEES